MKKYGRKLLIIDNDQHSISRLINLLQDDFYCYTANTARKGLELFERIEDDSPLVVCDVGLPDVVGFDVCKTIKARQPKTYVMLLSNYNSADFRITGLKSFADICLDKTVGDPEIRLLIRNAHNTMRPNLAIATPPATLSKQSPVRPNNFEIRVRDYIEAYFEQPEFQRVKSTLSLSSISSHLTLTERTFQRRIKAITGNSYVRYLSLVKIEKSKELLIANCSITQISEKLEYSSPSHYSREFKRTTNVTPNKYKLTVKELPKSVETFFDHDRGLTVR